MTTKFDLICTMAAEVTSKPIKEVRRSLLLATQGMKSDELFKEVPPEQIDQLKQQFSKERSGVLNWSIDGLKKLLDQ